MFGNVTEREIKHMTGKEVVGVIETVKLLVGAEPYRVLARINVDIEKSQVDMSFARKIGFLKDKQAKGEQRAKFILAGKRVQTVVSMADLSSKEYQMVIGRRDLVGFLLDPSRRVVGAAIGVEALPKEVVKSESTLESMAHFKHYKEVDAVIAEVDEQLKLLYHLKPLNLDSKRVSFLEGKIKNPQFVYPELRFDPYKLREKLDGVSLDDSLLGRLFQRKRHEVLEKLDLLEHRGAPHFSTKSAILFGEATALLTEAALARLSEKPAYFTEEKEIFSAEQAEKEFTRFFKESGLSEWRVKIKKEMVADCVAGKQNTFFVHEGASFTEMRLKMVIAHEIQTHIFTAENGKSQPYQLFHRGTGGYLTTQEGLAIYNQERAVDCLTEKHFWNAALVVAIQQAQMGSFRDVYDAMRAMGYDEGKAFQFALKSKRGLEDSSLPGAFTKDLIYFRGKQMIEEFVANGGDLKRLYVGKIDLPSLEEIGSLPFLVAPKYLP